ncbi:hypothetical protein LTR02_017987 [Friedmanniomyces endolithicus]|nr:hypothetical protein LTR94_023716 [Friedmanniomyces endolithicus]KAK0768000.1 hypothetical protein LTR59_018002 [Friedmanniomyces endolithicus]KAK0769044.1 hypothetical protein LTR38_017991 [Friedmanniomyces endolithicus]KAK0838583.1 hypothetical protein LTS02_017719 [Friedmanniomyces endolithicus]KAK0886606.1 hypothetical protein LTR02_017987 [Friedmanniomyces endolithicus]
MADIRLSSAKALGDKDLLNATSPAVLRFELAANMATLDGTESVWAGRAGEDVDFVIIVEGGRIKALNEISGIVGGLFKAMMDEFITTKRCTPSSEPPSERAQKWLRNRRWEGAQLPAR